MGWQLNICKRVLSNSLHQCLIQIISWVYLQNYTCRILLTLYIVTDMQLLYQRNGLLIWCSLNVCTTKIQLHLFLCQVADGCDPSQRMGSQLSAVSQIAPRAALDICWLASIFICSKIKHCYNNHVTKFLVFAIFSLHLLK